MAVVVLPDLRTHRTVQSSVTSGELRVSKEVARHARKCRKLHCRATPSIALEWVSGMGRSIVVALCPERGVCLSMR